MSMSFNSRFTTQWKWLMFSYSGVQSTKMSSNVTWHYNTDYVTVQIEFGTGSGMDPDPAGFRVVGSGPGPDPTRTKMSRSGLDPDPARSENCGSGAPLIMCVCIALICLCAPSFCVSLGSWVISLTGFGAGVTSLNEPPRALATSTIMWVRS